MLRRHIRRREREALPREQRHLRRVGLGLVTACAAIFLLILLACSVVVVAAAAAVRRVGARAPASPRPRGAAGAAARRGARRGGSRARLGPASHLLGQLAGQAGCWLQSLHRCRPHALRRPLLGRRHERRAHQKPAAPAPLADETKQTENASEPREIRDAASTRMQRAAARRTRACSGCRMRCTGWRGRRRPAASRGASWACCRCRSCRTTCPACTCA